jgi:hypothetical protein
VKSEPEVKKVVALTVLRKWNKQWRIMSHHAAKYSTGDLTGDAKAVSASNKRVAVSRRQPPLLSTQRGQALSGEDSGSGRKTKGGLSPSSSSSTSSNINIVPYTDSERAMIGNVKKLLDQPQFSSEGYHRQRRLGMGHGYTAQCDSYTLLSVFL